MSAIAVSDADFDSRVMRAAGPVLVEFWKKDCRPCHLFAPVVAQFAAERPDLTVATYEVVLDSRQHRRWKWYAINATPTMILFQGGKQVWRVGGLRSIEQLRQEVNAALAKTPQPGLV